MTATDLNALHWAIGYLAFLRQRAKAVARAAET